MDFDFTQEQVMLRALAREFFTRESTPRAVRTLMEEARGYSDATWQQLSEMGLPGLAIDAGYAHYFATGHASMNSSINSVDSVTGTVLRGFYDNALDYLSISFRAAL